MSNLQHRRTHNTLLISRLLNQREGASPFTLVLDTLEQPATPLLKEYIRRANLGRSHIIFVAYSTPRKPPGVDSFIPAWSKPSSQIVNAVGAASATTGGVKRCLVIIDNLQLLCVSALKSETDLTAFFGALLQTGQSKIQPVPTSIVAVSHTDIALPMAVDQYQPHPLTLLGYLATTTIHVHSLAVLLAHKRAQERSLGAPSFGLAEHKDGVVVGLKKVYEKDLQPEDRGVVLEIEHRRKSGRGVHEWYFLPSQTPTPKSSSPPSAFREYVTLLDDHRLFLKQRTNVSDSIDDDLTGVTFNLSLTDRQKMERESVVLPYFDAQRADTVDSGGGRILYDMGVEDDFDDEEDEI